MDRPLVAKRRHECRIVLLGVGHTHAEIVRRWSRMPRPGTRLICISDQTRATYSGMLPGAIAGQYGPERMAIDLPRLCRAAQVELHVGRATELDLARRVIHLESDVDVPFDVLSIGIGSRPNFAGVAGQPTQSMVAIKPMQTFLQRLDDRLKQCRDSPLDRPLEIVVVGGGAAGVEIACCLPNRLTKRLGPGGYRITLLDRGDQILSDFPDRAVEHVRRRLDDAGIQRRLRERVVSVDDTGLQTDRGARLPADLILWATGAAGPEFLERLQLPRDSRGFLWADTTLQVAQDSPVFVVGDSASLRGERMAKAGVFAVRQAPVLWDNLHRFLDGRPLRRFRPQRDFLRILNTGDGRAVLVYRGWSFHAGWCWRLKDAIDGRFIGKYQRLTTAAGLRPGP